MAIAIAASRRAPVGDVCALTLLFLASAAIVCGGAIGAAGGEALNAIDDMINRAAPTLADETVQAPAEVHPLVVAEQVKPFVLPFGERIQRERAMNCLTEAVYYEAGYQPVDGQAAVAQVVLNRVSDRNFPSTVCGVVYQGWKRRTGCQFSFACDGSRRRRPPTIREWERAEAVAERALNGYVMAEVGTATHYHTTQVRPWWKPSVVMTAQVGDHVFYRWPGRAGEVSALNPDRWSGSEPNLASPPRPREAVEMAAARRSKRA